MSFLLLSITYDSNAEYYTRRDHTGVRDFPENILKIEQSQYLRATEKPISAVEALTTELV
jgi:hypothetical protein